jgi:hypothetical protein
MARVRVNNAPNHVHTFLPNVDEYVDNLGIKLNG